MWGVNGNEWWSLCCQSESIRIINIKCWINSILETDKYIICGQNCGTMWHMTGQGIPATQTTFKRQYSMGWELVTFQQLIFFCKQINGSIRENSNAKLLWDFMNYWEHVRENWKASSLNWKRKKTIQNRRNSMSWKLLSKNNYETSIHIKEEHEKSRCCGRWKWESWYQ